MLLEEEKPLRRNDDRSKNAFMFIGNNSMENILWAIKINIHFVVKGNKK